MLINWLIFEAFNQDGSCIHKSWRAIATLKTEVFKKDPLDISDVDDPSCRIDFTLPFDRAYGLPVKGNRWHNASN